MDVALYQPWLKERGGVEKLVLEYARRSSHDVTVYTLFYDAMQTFDGFAGVDVEVLGDNAPPEGLLQTALRFGLGSATLDLPTEDHDALVVSEAGIGCLATLRNHDLPTLCYCHTPLRPALPDFTHDYVGEVNPLKRPFYKLLLWKYQYMERVAWGYFDAVVCNSETTRDRVLTKQLVPDDAVTVVTPGVDVDAFTPDGFGHYFLYPSRFRRYKRHELAIEAFQAADLPDGFRLVLAGSAQDADYVAELRAMAGDDVTVRTDVPEDEWRRLYEECYGVLFLAQEEDFGIVPVEGMAAGKPVVAVDEGGARESVVPGETGHLVDADPLDIAAAMAELAGDEEAARAMGDRGRDRAQGFSWDAFADALDAEVGAL